MTPPDGEALPMPDVKSDNEPKDVLNNFWVSLVVKVGLPTALVIWFVFSMNGKVDTLIQLNQKMITILEIMSRR